MTLRRYSVLLFFLCSIQLTAQYHVFESDGNLVSQEVIQTSDGGYFLTAVEYCFTPGAIAIEGCTYAMHLVRTDATGDTLWTNVISYSTQYGPGVELFEHADGSFTIAAITNQAYQCDGIFVGLSGFRQIQLYNISAAGGLMSETAFPDNCALILRDIIQVADNQFAVLATYERPISINDVPEGRLFLMDNNGTIGTELTFPDELLRSGTLLLDDQDQILLLYSDSENHLHLNTYDLQLQLLNETSDTDLEYDCYGQLSTALLSDNSIGMHCFRYSTAIENSHFMRLDQNLSVLAENTLTLNRPTNFVETTNGELAIASLDAPADMISNTQITYLSADLDSLNSLLVTGSQLEAPSSIIVNAAGDFAIAGNVNCCNIDSMTGPSRSFLLLVDEVVSNDDLLVDDEMDIAVYPNPATSHVDFWLSADEANSSYVLHFYSPLGELLAKRVLAGNSTRLDLSNYPDGVYFYSIQREGLPVKNGKVVRHGG